MDKQSSVFAGLTSTDQMNQSPNQSVNHTSQLGEQ